ncbi:hypothetical protein [Kribbella sp. NPDC004536]
MLSTPPAAALQLRGQRPDLAECAVRAMTADKELLVAEHGLLDLPR